jgi:hypothetical protein
MTAPMDTPISTQRLLQIAHDELKRNLEQLSEMAATVSTDTQLHSEEQEPLQESSSQESGEAGDNDYEYYEEEDVGLQLIGLKIAQVPAELIEMTKDKVTKLSLQNNWLNSLPSQFRNMARLGYLDISHNRLTEFPEVLCNCPALEILDISSNQISTLPRYLGNLADSLKVLSLSNNKFEYLPPCIADIVDLRFLEIDNNPLILPPKEIVDAKNKDQQDQLDWVERVKQYLSDNRQQILPLIECDEQPSVPPISRPGIDMNHKLKSGEPVTMGSWSTRSASTSPERVRSNSEGQVSSRAAKRMGFIVKKRTPNNTPVTQSSNGLSEETHETNHVRVQSHDSALDMLERPRSTRSRVGSVSTSPVVDSAPGAYFRRLSTLPEEARSSNQLDIQIMEASRKALFAVHEFHDIVRRCSAFCTDKSLVARLASLLQTARGIFPEVVAALEKHEKDSDTLNLLTTIVKCMDAVREISIFFRTSLDRLTTFIDIKFIRTLIMVTFASLNELNNAWNVLHPADTVLPSEEELSTAAADEQLYDRIYFAVGAAQSVLGQLTEAISKSAAAVQGPGQGVVVPSVATKVKDLTNTCVAGVEVTRRLKQRMETMKDTGIIDRRKFWEDTNAFLKAVIAILASTKTAMDDLPFLADARPNLSTLTRVAKEIPVLLEYSSYKVLMNEPTPPPALPETQPPPPTTPLVAVLGPAAQAVMSPTYYGGNYSSPFIPGPPSASSEGHTLSMYLDKS